MHPHEELIESFYTSFQKLDAEGMVRCYHADIRFSDPVFPVLSKTEVGAMWKMLCSQRSAKLTVAGGSGHNIPGERPDIVDSAIEELIRNLQK